MNFESIHREHREWWSRNRAGEASDLPALGLFKALRNFAHPLLQSRYKPRPGIDWHGQAEEAIGDMFMYLCSVAQAADLRMAGESNPWTLLSAEEAAAYTAEKIAYLVRDQIQENLSWAVAAVLDLCRVCVVDPEVACRRALCKLRSVS